MKLYLRILGYLRPHLAGFLGAVLATVAFAGLDAFAYVLLIPFVDALFGGASTGTGGAFRAPGAASQGPGSGDPTVTAPPTTSSSRRRAG